MAGGWVRSTRAARLPRDWPARRARVLDRDGHRCRLNIPGVCVLIATDADHIHAGDDHRETNLQAACRPCHDRKSSAEGHAARARFTLTRPPESHPGVL